jgi:hypothetical protein
LIDFATLFGMETTLTQGKLIAVGPIFKTTVQTMKVAVRLEELPPSPRECTCEWCHNIRTETQKTLAYQAEENR